MLPLPGLIKISNRLPSFAAGILVLLLLIPFRLDARDDSSLLMKQEFMEDVRHAIHLAYNMEYKESLEYLSEWREQHPEHPIWVFWPILDKWWDVVSDLEQEDFDEQFFDFIDESLEASEAYSDRYPDNIDSMIINAAAYGFTTRLHSNRHNWYRTIRYARRAMRYLRKIEELYPEMPDVEFGNGMYYYFSAFLQDEYPAVRIISWALPDGDREKGLELLDYVAEEGIILGPESQYFLGHIYLHYERSYSKSLPYLEQMAQSFPKNALYTRLLIRTHFRNQNYSEAQRLLYYALNEQEFVYSPHIELATKEELYFMSGRIKLHYGNNDDAVDDFQKALEAGYQLSEEPERNFQVQAGYYLGEAYLRIDERQKARDQFVKIANANTNSYVKERAKNRLDYLN